MNIQSVTLFITTTLFLQGLPNRNSQYRLLVILQSHGCQFGTLPACLYWNRNVIACFCMSFLKALSVQEIQLI